MLAGAIASRELREHRRRRARRLPIVQLGSANALKLAPGSASRRKRGQRVQRATATRRGCRIKPSRKSRGALKERHARAAMRDDLATDDMRVTDEMAVFETHP